MNTEAYASLNELWKYLSASPTLTKCEIAFVLGRDDFSIPEKTVELYQKGFISKIILLGGRGRLTGSIVGSEAGAFKKYLISKNVPTKNIYLEEKSANTGENIVEGLKLLKEKNLFPKSIYIVTHAPHIKRSLAAAKAQDSSIEWLSCPDNCILPDINSSDLSKVAEELIGEISRLENYPKLGYFEEQNIPENIISAKKSVETWLNNQNKKSAP